MYGMMYVVKRTTIYLPEDLKAALEQAALQESRTEADLIREGIEKLLATRHPRPTIPLFESSLPPDAAEHFDDYLQGFGED
jgi:hypothetical protein